MSSINNQLHQLLSTVRTPGNFYATGTVDLWAPQIMVEGVGAVALPLLPLQVEQLITAAERAPFGRGEETLVDTAVRRTWQIQADRVQISGKAWEKTLASVVQQVAEGLGVMAAVVPELYKLLVYDTGSFFVSHRDTEKSPGMFATLVIALPSVHTGGEMVIRHKNEEVRLNLTGDDPSQAAFAAFYADCVHEVLPVTSGCRLVLVYNLIRSGPGPTPKAPNYETEVAQLQNLLQSWVDEPRGDLLSNTKALDEEGLAEEDPEEEEQEEDAQNTPEKLVYLLEHAYTEAELSFSALKGADAAVADVMTHAAAAANCELHLALLTIEENGWAEHTGGYYRSYGRRRHYEEDKDEFEIGEVCDRTAELRHWQKPDGHAADLGDLPFNDEEACPSGILETLEPDELEFSEATGNEGASFERTYQRATLVLWPKTRWLAVLNQGDLRATLPKLHELTQQWQQSGTDQTSVLWQQAHELSGHMLQTWSREAPYQCSGLQTNAISQVLQLLIDLDDVRHIELCLTSVCSRPNCCNSDDIPTLIQAFQFLPAKRVGELLQQWQAAYSPAYLVFCADVLAKTVAAGYGAVLGAAAKTLLKAMPGDSPINPSFFSVHRRQATDKAYSGFLVDLLPALERIDPSLAQQAADHVLAWPQTYALDGVLVPTMRSLSAQTAHKTLASVVRLRQACQAHLNARVAQELHPPADWRRESQLSCVCAHCEQLSRFLADTTQKTWAFKAVENAREHVSDVAKRNNCDLSLTTDRTGRPYTLWCTKNQASYERRVEQRQQDLKDLDAMA